LSSVLLVLNRSNVWRDSREFREVLAVLRDSRHIGMSATVLSTTLKWEMRREELYVIRYKHWPVVALSAATKRYPGNKRE
jgi:hypothetical protein